MQRSRALTRDVAISPGLIDEVRRMRRPLSDLRDLDALMSAIGDARYVLLGEASHGTHEYYTWRTAISRRLILEKGFSFIAVEGDWPDCQQVDRYIKRVPGAAKTAYEALRGFHRWPTWMWANEETAALAEWLREHNRDVPPAERISFYGLDVYSLWDSLYEVHRYLVQSQMDGSAAARRALRCFEPYGEDPQKYARDVLWTDQSCEHSVVQLLGEVRQRAAARALQDGETSLNAEQHAQIVRNAERYYRTMVRGGPQSWNIRDRHMADTLDRLVKHHGPEAKAIIWEHNTHIGDARFTDMSDAGMFNLGELARREHTEEGVFLVGFSGYAGTVIAGREWGAPQERMRVPPARPGSWEDVLHQSGPGDGLLIFNPEYSSPELRAPRGQRAIGVIYDPDEELGNYVPTELPHRYDALLSFEVTRALRPLAGTTATDDEIPETYPTGL